MNETLRPSSLGEILDRTAQLYRRNFLLFAGTAALPVAAMLAIGIVAGLLFGAVAAVFRGESLPTAMAGVALFVALAAILPVYIAAGVFSYAGLTQAAVSTHRGERPTIRATLAGVRPRFWRYLWLILLQGILVILVPGVVFGAVVGVLVYLASNAGLGAGAALGFFAVVVGAAGVFVISWCALGCSMGFAACVVEQKTAWESLQRSWNLARGSRGRIFVLYLLVMALQFAGSMAGYILSFLILGISAAVGSGAQDSTVVGAIAALLQLMVSFSLQVLLTPVSWIALVLFYYDQRIRKEGFDIEWMMEQAGLVAQAPAAPASSILGISGPAQFASPGAPDPNGGVSGLVAPPDSVPPDTVEER